MKQIWKFAKGKQDANLPLSQGAQLIRADSLLADYDILSDTAANVTVMVDESESGGQSLKLLTPNGFLDGEYLLTIGGTEIKGSKKTLSRAIHKISQKIYFDRLDTAVALIKAAVINNGFDDSLIPYYWADQTTEETNRGSWEVTNGAKETEIAHLTMTWYKMPSGRWEIVAYVS